MNIMNKIKDAYHNFMKVEDEELDYLISRENETGRIINSMRAGF